MSKRKISRLRHKLFGRLTAFNQQNEFDVEIQRDPLHRRYAVNRHGIDIKDSNRDHVIRFRNLLCSSLLGEGWTFSQKYGYDVFATTFEGVAMAIWVSNVSTYAGQTAFSVNPGTGR